MLISVGYISQWSNPYLLSVARLCRSSLGIYSVVLIQHVLTSGHVHLASCPTLPCLGESPVSRLQCHVIAKQLERMFVFEPGYLERCQSFALLEEDCISDGELRSPNCQANSVPWFTLKKGRTNCLPYILYKHNTYPWLGCRLWGTLPAMAALKRPISIKQLREALARTGTAMLSRQVCNNVQQCATYSCLVVFQLSSVRMQSSSNPLVKKSIDKNGRKRVVSWKKLDAAITKG